MKFIVVPILILLIITQTFSKWIVIIDYQINKTYIAKNLCVNRKMPKMHCNGNCVLTKKMRAEEKQEAPSGIINWGKSVQLFASKYSSFICLRVNRCTKEFIIENTLLSKEEFTHPVFRPPLV